MSKVGYPEKPVTNAEMVRLWETVARRRKESGDAEGADMARKQAARYKNRRYRYK